VIGTGIMGIIYTTWTRDSNLIEMVVGELDRPAQTRVLSEIAGKGVHRRLEIER
jgi:hypothetical protein